MARPLARRELRRRAARGFTLVEIVFVSLIVAVISAVAAPSMMNVVVAQRLRAAGTDLVQSLQLARSEAIKRNGNVTVAPAGDHWKGGWVVTNALGDAIDKRASLGNRVAVSSAPATIIYQPSGRLSVAGGARVQFNDAESESGVTPRCVIIDTSGYPRVESRSC